MGIMDMFRTALTAPPAAGAPPNTNMGSPGNIPPVGLENGGTAFAPGTAPNGAIPKDGAEAPPKNPLDEFTKLWETDPNAQKTGNDPYFNVNMEALTKAAGSQDFLSSVTPEQLAGIAKGGPEAVKAFAIALNTVARDVYARSAFAATKIAESGLLKAEGKMRGEVPGLIKRNSLNEALLQENPALLHPAAQPLISAMQMQMQLKYPNASATELRDMATQYLTAFATAANAPTTKAAEAEAKRKAGAGEPDWDAFLTS